jgi:short-subunit dehydrogenase
LIFVSSIGARTWQPINAPYASSKAALSMLGHCLRLELRGQGVSVTIVEPGAVATEIWRKGGEAFTKFSPEHPARAFYGREMEGLLSVAQQFQKQAVPASVAGEKILRCLESRRAPRRVVVGRDASLMSLLHSLLPLSGIDALLIRALKL